jgi:hypothetical protein
MPKAGRSRGSSPNEVILIFSVFLILSTALLSWDLLSLLQKCVSEDRSGGKSRPADKVDNLTAICKPIV